MKFKIAKKIIYNGLVTVARAISANSPLPALSGIKFDCKKDHLILTGSNSDISIQTKIYPNKNYILEIIETGQVVIETKYILEIVRKIDADVIILEIVDGSLTKISGDTAEFKINGVRASDYPNIDFNKPEINFSIDAYSFKNVINQTTFATSDRDNRPLLNGVNFIASEGKLECVGTDSFRLAKKTININNNDSFNIIIPAKSLNEVEKIIDRDEPIEVAISEKKIQFYFENTLIQTRLIDGKFPDVSRLIPNEFLAKLVIEGQDMLNAIDRASFIKNDGVSVIKLSLSTDEVIMSSKSQEVGSSVEKLVYQEYIGDPLTISFSGRYVFDAIRYLNSQKIIIEFSSENKPFIIKMVDDESIVQLIVPVKTFN